MKNTFSIVALTAVLAVTSLPLAAQQLELPRPSPKGSVMQRIGLTDVTINYSRPSVKGRKIWGELVPMDKVWRVGANEATSIAFTDDVTIDGKKLKAGTYSLHAIPGKETWTLIFNSVADQWGSYSYDAAKDVLRISIKPVTMNTTVESMLFVFPEVSESAATAALVWQNVSVPFKIEADVKTKAMSNIKAAIAAAKADDWRTSFQGAQYAFNTKSNWPEAKDWIAKSVATKATLANLTLHARMLAAEGKKADAIAAAEKAVMAGKEQKADASAIAATEKLVAEWKAAK